MIKGLVLNQNTNVVYGLMVELANMVSNSVLEKLKETNGLFNKVIEVEGNAADEKSDELLTIKEVCEILKVKRGTLYSWKKRGILVPDARIGRMVRYSKSTIDAYVKNIELKND